MQTLVPRLTAALPSRLSAAVDSEQWELARRIHRSMLPQGFCDERVEIVVRYDQVDVVGGDYFSLFKTDDDKLFLCLYHVNGRGVAGALMATRIDSFVRHEISVVGHPCEVVERLQRFVRQHFGQLNLQAAFFCVELDLRWGGLTYAGAGHPPALLWHKNGDAIERLESLNPLLGSSAETAWECHLQKTSVEPGDRLLLFSASVIETKNAAGDFLGVGSLESAFSALPADARCNDTIEEIVAMLRRFGRIEKFDNDTLIVAGRFF